MDGIVRAAAFETCAMDAAVSCAAAVCAAVVGAAVAEVARTTPSAIARLGGVADGSPAARAVHFALQGGLRPFLRPAAARGGDIVCACFSLTRGDVVETIRDGNARTIEELQALLPATRGCGTCRPDVEELLARERR